MHISVNKSNLLAKSKHSPIRKDNSARNLLTMNRYPDINVNVMDIEEAKSNKNYEEDMEELREIKE
jgi:hypothetical protein